MKKCFVCNEVKSLDLFYKHSRMADGHFNKCKMCHLEYSKKYRELNPEYRKIEYAKHAKKIGTTPRAEFLHKRSLNKKSRKAISLDYFNKRRSRFEKYEKTELDNFVFHEAFLLIELRNRITKIKWHIDHIVPLNHKYASGFHNAFNLQVVPEKWNLRKSNVRIDKLFGEC